MLQEGETVTKASLLAPSNTWQPACVLHVISEYCSE